MKYAGRERYIHRVAESTSLLRGGEKKQETHTHTGFLLRENKQSNKKKWKVKESTYLMAQV